MLDKLLMFVILLNGGRHKNEKISPAQPIMNGVPCHVDFQIHLRATSSIKCCRVILH